MTSVCTFSLLPLVPYLSSVLQTWHRLNLFKKCFDTIIMRKWQYIIFNQNRWGPYPKSQEQASEVTCGNLKCYQYPKTKNAKLFQVMKMSQVLAFDCNYLMQQFITRLKTRPKFSIQLNNPSDIEKKNGASNDALGMM